jgi:hypothetical protein
MPQQRQWRMIQLVWQLGHVSFCCKPQHRELPENAANLHAQLAENLVISLANPEIRAYNLSTLVALRALLQVKARTAQRVHAWL